MLCVSLSVCVCLYVYVCLCVCVCCLQGFAQVVSCCLSHYNQYVHFLLLLLILLLLLLLLLLKAKAQASDSYIVPHRLDQLCFTIIRSSS